MSILMALTGKERIGLRLFALCFSLSSAIAAIVAARPDLLVVHICLSMLHFSHLPEIAGFKVAALPRVARA